MKKSGFALIIAVVFLAGGAIANTDILAEATGGNGDGAWAKLVARVTGLENQLGGNTIKTVTLQDGESGWNPPVSFSVNDPDIKADSIVIVSVQNFGSGNMADCSPDVFDGGFEISGCDPSVVFMGESTAITYTVINKNE